VGPDERNSSRARPKFDFPEGKLNLFKYFAGVVHIRIALRAPLSGAKRFRVTLCKSMEIYVPFAERWPLAGAQKSDKFREGQGQFPKNFLNFLKLSENLTIKITRRDVSTQLYEISL
jgi:hypothetical protein